MNELKLLEIYGAENARDKILQELEDRGFCTESKNGALGLGEKIVDIILQECWPVKYKSVTKKSCHSYQSPPDEDEDELKLNELLLQLTEEDVEEIKLDELLQQMKEEDDDSLDKIFDDFMNDRNPQSEIS